MNKNTFRIFPKEVKESNSALLERKNVVPFTSEQKERLIQQLEEKQFFFACQILDVMEFDHEEHKYWALLTDEELSFETKGDISEILKITLECLNDDEFVGYDSQNEKWIK